MSNIVKINNHQVQIIAYKGERVCTTRQLAQLYGCSEKNIGDNFDYSRTRFEEGKHFVFLEGDALRAFKGNIPENSGDVPKHTARLILWTERGAARHAKMLTTSEAWDVFEQMEDVYFTTKEVHSIGHKLPDQIEAGVYLLRSVIQDLKLAPSAVLSGYQRLEAQIGVKGLLPAYSVDGSATSTGGTSDETKSIAELLKIHGIGMSAIAFNRLLIQHNMLEERERQSSKGKTKKFKICTNLEFGKNITSASSPRQSQPHWYVHKFQELLGIVMPTSTTTTH